MNIVQRLHSVKPHPSKAVLSAFPLAGIAELVGCSSSYVCAVLNGSRKGSKALDDKLMGIVKEVEQELEKHENTPKRD